MGNDNFQWNQPMVSNYFQNMLNKFDWSPCNMAKNWMNFCIGLEGLPFISRTLWQAGPMPWLLNGGANWGNIGDGFIPGNPTIKATTSTDNNSNTNKTSEEILKENEEKAAETADKKKIVKNYKSLYSIMNNFAESLSDTTDPSKDNFKEILKKYPDKLNENTAKESLEKSFTNLKAVFDKYKDKIKSSCTEKMDKELHLNNDMDRKTTYLYNTLTHTNHNLDSFLDGENLKSDVDIIDLLSSWNNNPKTDNTHIMKHLGINYAKSKNKDYDRIANALHNALLEKAGKIETDKLSDEVKKELEKAITTFNKFDTIEKRFFTGEKIRGENYSKAFDNLYRAIRLAEAEIAGEQIEEFSFLGEDNPYKDSEVKDKVAEDLKEEGLENSHSGIQNPKDQEVIRGDNGYFAIIENGSAKYYRPNNIEDEDAFKVKCPSIYKSVQKKLQKTKKVTQNSHTNSTTKNTQGEVKQPDSTETWQYGWHLR